MSKWKIAMLIGSTLLFIAFVVLAIAYESTYYLHIASALPILIVLWLPDTEKHQYIRGKHKKNVRLVVHHTGEHGKLTITFPAGYVQWKKSKVLYFHLDSLTREQTAATAAGDFTPASLAVLPYDLTAHPRKSGWIGINLEHLADRTAGMSVTTSEITQLVLQLRDVEQLAIQHMSSAAPVVRKGNQMQA
ncbi:hypothetical protein [Paenibacillus sp. YYML68]|uniref:hypothetical protein n=1 Tax=Paenibacillus sp. YYML68 TaxID=2909250 RepID=UPI002491A485|nr:hypothetical protein [Paenibacillus sp. YYML68]